ncbi:MAG: 16S rRNA (cytosine(1402)-N(4))-methyltransferase, partial [Gammaproteobacteria bacterium]|nr:16S rRNA (cytosine(1402)-N(4))-methyltransferase [Gammaproteobacteria bacterium]
MRHVPVLLEETVAAVAVARDGVFADVTYGSGGHSRRLLEHLEPAARLLVLDRDEDAVADARALAARAPRVRVRHAPFSRIGEVPRS